MSEAKHAATINWRPVNRGRQFWGLMSTASLLAVFSGTPFRAAFTTGQIGSFLFVFTVLLWASLIGLSVSDRDPGAKKKKPRRGTVYFDEQGLHYERDEGSGLVEPEQIDTGWLEPGSESDAATLVLRLHGNRELCLEMARREAEELLAVLGGDARVVRMPLVADSMWVRGCVGAFIAWFVSTGGVMLAVGLMVFLQAFRHPDLFGQGLHFSISGLLTVAVMLPLRHFMMPAKIEVGSEGLIVHRFLRRRLYLPFSEFKLESVAGAALRLKLKDGPTISVRASPEAAQAVYDTVAQRKQRFDLSHDENVVEILGQGFRTTDDWRAALSALLGEQSQDYRTAPIEPEQIMAVLDDPAASPEQRVAAAYALAHAPSDGAGPQQESYQDKIRIVADGVASPKLRIALEQAADGELDRQALSAAELQLETAQRREGYVS